MIKRLRQWFYTYSHTCLNKLRRSMQRRMGFATLGVRAIVINAHGQVLLVKHNYSLGWYLPGGGIEIGEHPIEAIIRELKEETGVIVNAEPKLLGVFYHTIQNATDYPFLYEVKEFDLVTVSCLEIAEIGWFDYDKLPLEVTPATQRRLNEYFLHEKLTNNW